MIINSSKVKSEALLLFCRELIKSYKDSKDELFHLPEETKEFINTQSIHLHKAINVSIQPKEYYLRNQKVSRIGIILRTYEFLNKNVSRKLKNGDKFNPAMLCFSLLSTWFAELSIGEEDKEYLYFCLYPYGEIYDTLLINLEDNEYKKLNMFMLNIAEDTVFKLENYRFKNV